MNKSINVAFCGATIWLVLSGFASNPLADFQGRSRVLILSAPSSDDVALLRQNQWLHTGSAGLRERDVMVIQVIGREVDAPIKLKSDASSLRRHARLAASKFGLALIGKDGSEAFQQDKPITMQALFEIIDAMPMRKREIKLQAR